MNILEAMFLGILQGLTEFIPISSSAHLDVIPKIFGWHNPSTFFDTFLHIGTFLALLVYFRTKIFTYLVVAFKFIFNKKLDQKSEKQSLFVLRNIILATIPAALIGLLFETYITNLFDNKELDKQSNLIIALAMIFMGILLIVYPRFIKGKRMEIYNLGILRSFIIGTAQAIAFVRGVSRSGVSIVASQFVGLRRIDAAEFSFLMSIPIMFLTSIYSIYELFFLNNDSKNEYILPSIVGMFTSFIFGILAIKFLLSFLKNNSLAFFGVYRIVFGILIILVFYL
jgi:undecaprenyl-diphosphatase